MRVACLIEEGRYASWAQMKWKLIGIILAIVVLVIVVQRNIAGNEAHERMYEALRLQIRNDKIMNIEQKEEAQGKLYYDSHYTKKNSGITH